MIAWIVIALLVVGTFVAAYFASRTWHWANVTLMVLIVLVSVFYTVLTAKVISIRSEYGRRIAKSEKELEDYQERNRALEEGTRQLSVLTRLTRDEIRVPEGEEPFLGTQDLDHLLHLRTRLRGAVWRNVSPTGTMDPNTGLLPVTIDFPNPHGLEENAIVYAFGQGDYSQGAQYLGEFLVKEANETGVMLQAILQLDEDQLERLNTSDAPWVLYDSLPVDEHQPFVQLTDDQLRKSLPEKTVIEYIRNGEPRNPDDNQWHVRAYDETDQLLGPDSASKAEGNVHYLYERLLRDYSFIFQELAHDRILILASMAALNKDNTKLDSSIEGAKGLQSYRENELQKLSVDLRGVKRDRLAIEGHLAKLAQQVNTARKLLQDTLRENSRLATELAELQHALAGMVDQQAGL